MSQISPPIRILIVCAVAFLAAWMLFLRPSADAGFVKYVRHPELAMLLPVLYPGVFPNLQAYTNARADLEAILMTGLPSGVVGGFQNFTGPRPSDMLRLNMAVPPSDSPSTFGILGGDLAGFPNGRRPSDDVVAIELRAVAGATIPLVDPSFTPDGAGGEERRASRIAPVCPLERCSPASPG